jgi:hypothetical protein
MSGAIKVIFFCFGLTFLLILYGWKKKDRFLSMPTIVLELKKENNTEEYILKKDDQKEIKKYCKENKISVITKEDALSQYNKRNSEIMAPLFQTPADQLEEKKKRIKREILSIPEIAKWITIKFYSSDTNSIDSSSLIINSFPYSEKNNIKINRSIIFETKISLLNCIKASIDTCIKNSYLK